MYYENGWVKFYGEEGVRLARKHSENMAIFQAATLDLFGSEYKRQIEKALSKTNFVYFGDDCVDDIKKNQNEIIRQVCDQQGVSEINKGILLRSNFDLNNDVDGSEYQLFIDFLQATYPKLYRGLHGDNLDAFYYYVKKGVKFEEKDTLVALLNSAEGGYLTDDEVKEKMNAIHNGFLSLLDAHDQISKNGVDYFMNYMDDAGILDRIRSFNLSNEDFYNVFDNIVERIYSGKKSKSFAFPIYSKEGFLADNIMVFGNISTDVVGLMLESVASDMGWLDDQYVYRIGFMDPKSEGKNGLCVMWMDWCTNQIAKKMSAMGVDIDFDVSDGKKNLKEVSSYFDSFFEENKAEMTDYFFTAYNKKLVEKIGKDMFDKINEAANMLEEIRFLSSDKEVSAACKIAKVVIKIKDKKTLEINLNKNDIRGCDINAVKFMTQSLLGVKELVDSGKKKD